MEFKKCPRCGNFFHSDLEVCQSCKTNEILDVQKLRNYIETNGVESCENIQQVSIATGINTKNLSRFILSEEFTNIFRNNVN